MEVGTSEKEKAGERLFAILEGLRVAYGTRPWNWHTGQSPFEVLIGTVLSQRTRDEKTDQAAMALLARYPTVREMARAPIEDIEILVRPANYYRTKAKRIQSICRVLLERYAGEVPREFEALMTLPGVGRKTAACVLVYGFGEPAVPVDTHVHRLANRMGLISTKRPEETERELAGMVHPDQVLLLNELFVKHGQTVCKPIRPLCERCGVGDRCDRSGDLQPGFGHSRPTRRKQSQLEDPSRGPAQSKPRQVSSRKDRSPLSR